jgi:hypothetical protein
VPEASEAGSDDTSVRTNALDRAELAAALEKYPWRRPGKAESLLQRAQLEFIDVFEGATSSTPKVAAKTYARWQQALVTNRLRARLANWLHGYMGDHMDDFPTIAVSLGRVKEETGQEVHPFQWLLPRFDVFCQEYIDTMNGEAAGVAVPMRVMGYILAKPQDGDFVEGWFDGCVEPFLVSFANWIEAGHSEVGDPGEEDEAPTEAQPEPETAPEPEPEPDPEVTPAPTSNGNPVDDMRARLEAEGFDTTEPNADPEDVPFHPDDVEKPADDDDDDGFDIDDLLGD